ncbi:MAG: winged helix-turn-helix transcriptional regulator [Deltaproteobacteria bacterium]|nr:MAG: winged helix-turn-helix transcriptional regulator [Deltaproteobacteria bacterium]
MASSTAKALVPFRFGSLAQAASWFRALGDETRLQIIDRLSEGEQCVCDLTDLLETKQSLLSFHLKTLKEAGILKDRREGRWVYYSLNPDALEALEQFAGTLKERSRNPHVVRKCCD